MGSEGYTNIYKWKKYQILSRNDKILEILPEMRTFDRKNFWALMEKYGVVLVKRLYGANVSGTLKVSALGKERYKVQTGDQEFLLEGEEETYGYFINSTSPTHLLAQQWIDLAQINEKFFSIYLIVQQNLKKGWEVTGYVTKLSEDENLSALSKAEEITPLEGVLQQLDFSDTNENLNLDFFKKSALTIVKELQPHYEKSKDAGLDFGIDRYGRVWFLGINYNPAFDLFSYLEDESVYGKMIELVAQRKRIKEKLSKKNKNIKKNKNAKNAKGDNSIKNKSRKQVKGTSWRHPYLDEKMIEMFIAKKKTSAYNTLSLT